MTVKKELDLLYSLKYITRYNNLPRLQNESVAEHSYFVSLIVARLHRIYDFNLEEALLTAVIHDIFEIYISDVPRNVKKEFPALDIVLENVEAKVIEDKFPEYKVLIDNFNNKSTAVGLITKYADTLSVLQYAETEVKLGSTTYMPCVVEQAKKDIKILEDKLKKYKRIIEK